MEKLMHKLVDLEEQETIDFPYQAVESLRMTLSR
jgi:hypothetical protein